MKHYLSLIFLLSTIGITACTKTEFQFGQPAETPVMHDNMGNMRENMQLDPLAPISDKGEDNSIAKPIKTVQPKIELKTQITSKPIKEAPATIEQVASPQDGWQPNEALLFRGMEILSGLQQEVGTAPSTDAMLQRLQTHMGLSADHASKLIIAIKQQN